jgi:hypothetical protein
MAEVLTRVLVFVNVLTAGMFKMRNTSFFMHRNSLSTAPEHIPLYTPFFQYFKQAYDTNPRQDLWQHPQRTCMPASFLSSIQDMYDTNEHILKDGENCLSAPKNRCV